MASFPQFNSLPPELRLQIWEAALPGPRVIPLNLGISKDRPTTTKPPILLGVCQESRYIVLQNYHRAITTINSHNGIYINPLIDTILLQPPCPVSCYQQPNCFECFHWDWKDRLSRYRNSECIESVAFYDFALEGLGHVWEFFPRMKRALIVVDDQCPTFLQWQSPMAQRMRVRLSEARGTFAGLGGLDVPDVRAVMAGAMQVGNLKERGW